MHSTPRRYKVKQIERTIYSFMLEPYNIWIKGIKSIHTLNHATLIWRSARGLSEDLGMTQKARDKSSEYFLSVVWKRTVSLHFTQMIPRGFFSTSWLLKGMRKGSPLVPLTHKRKVRVILTYVKHLRAFAAMFLSSASRKATTLQSISELSALLLQKPPEDFPTWLLQILFQWEMSLGFLIFVVFCLPHWLRWHVSFTNL